MDPNLTTRPDNTEDRLSAAHMLYERAQVVLVWPRSVATLGRSNWLVVFITTALLSPPDAAKISTSVQANDIFRLRLQRKEKQKATQTDDHLPASSLRAT